VSNATGRKQIDGQGYAILPQVVSLDIINKISDEISQSDSRRSRAGWRHAMPPARVKEVASGSKLMTLARDVLGAASLSFSSDCLRQISRRELARSVASGYRSATAKSAGSARVGTLVDERRDSLRTCARSGFVASPGAEDSRG
jgi:hypothetical protein